MKSKKETNVEETTASDHRISDEKPVGGDGVTLGRLVKERRLWLGLSRSFVAQKLAMTTEQIEEREEGREPISGPELRQLAHLLRCPEAVLQSPSGKVPTDVHLPAHLLEALNRPGLTDHDREALLMFWEFLRYSGPAQSEEAASTVAQRTPRER